MAGRAGRRGSVRQDSNGTWFFIVDIADATGRRQQTRRRGYASRREAQTAMTELLSDLDKGVYVPPSRRTLKAFLEEEWLPAVVATVRPATWDSYSRVLRLHVIPTPIGSLPLQDVNGPKLNALYARLLRPKPAGHGLSPRSVQYVHVILHRAFRDAVSFAIPVIWPTLRVGSPAPGSVCGQRPRSRSSSGSPPTTAS
jgi:integrase